MPWDESRNTRPFNNDGSPRKPRKDKGRIKKTHCPKGHDVSIAGREEHGRCSVCARLAGAQLQAKHYAKHRPKRLADSRLVRTGWTQEAYTQACLSQKGLCSICGRPPTAIGLVADHCHDTNLPRRLLCRKCNAALGLFRDDPWYSTARSRVPNIARKDSFMIAELIQRVADKMYNNHIWRNSDEIYMARYFTKPTQEQARWFLHNIRLADSDGHHNHPYTFQFSIVLSGSYVEETLDTKTMQIVTRTRRWVNWIPGNKYHIIIRISDTPCWTIFVHGPKTGKSWGFWVPGLGHIHNEQLDNVRAELDKQYWTEVMEPSRYLGIVHV